MGTNRRLAGLLGLAAALAALTGTEARQAGPPKSSSLLSMVLDTPLAQTMQLAPKLEKLIDEKQYAEALPLARKLLDLQEQRFPAKDYPNGHIDLVGGLTGLALVLEGLGEPDEALPHLLRGLGLLRKMHAPGGSRDGDLDIAGTLSKVGSVLLTMGQPARALPYYQEALALCRKHHKGPNEDVSTNLSSVGVALLGAGQPRKALAAFEEALAISKKLFPGGHDDTAVTLSSLASAAQALGDLPKALDYNRQALAMREKLYPASRWKNGHPDLVLSLYKMGVLHLAAGKSGPAAGDFEKALAMQDRLVGRDIAGLPEVTALAFLRSLPRSADGLLSVVAMGDDAAATYASLWPSRSVLFRQMLRRHEAAQAARLTDEKARKQWLRLAEVRRQVSKQLFDPGDDPAARDRLLEKLKGEQGALELELSKVVPQLDGGGKLLAAGPGSLAGKLPARSAFLDVVKYARLEKGKLAGAHYAAFVTAPGASTRAVELGRAAPLDDAVTSWRRAIEAGRPSDAPALLRKALWRPIEEKLPAGTTTVYLSLDGGLNRLPFAALPGRRPDTVLLEDYAFAVVPNGAWLLDRLSRPAEKGGPLLALGAVDFGKASGGPARYRPLPETGRELDRVQEAFRAAPGDSLRGPKATAKALLDRLPAAGVAHLATHAYFDEKALKGEQERERRLLALEAAGAPRAGLGARNPLGFVGLVLAGGNDPAKGGVVTGLDILALPLEKLQLCVLSACETGLGEWDEFAGVRGLQHAFHLAGCRDVVGSLWGVSDAATAALMARFYHELRVHKKTPLEALRTAQLAVYHHPEGIGPWAEGRGPGAAAVAGPGAAAKGKKADPRLWAAFVLSGPGT